MNFSKSGMSATVGVKGFGINVGGRGAYLNTALPGTGISSRVRLDSGPSRVSAPSRGSSVPISRDSGSSWVSPGNGSGPPIFYDMGGESYEIASVRPELLTSETLFGLKDAIVQALEIKQELKCEIDKTESIKNREYLVLILTYLMCIGIFIPWFRRNYKLRCEEAEGARYAYDAFNLSIDFMMDQYVLHDYLNLRDCFLKVAKCQKILDVTSQQAVNRVATRSSASMAIGSLPVVFSTVSVDHIGSQYEAMKMENANGADLYLYPGFVLVFSMLNSSFAVVDFRNISLEYEPVTVLEPGRVPHDARVVDRTWQYVNKNGTPDRRFRDNREIPVVLYYLLTIRSTQGMHECYLFSDVDAGAAFCAAFETYRQSLCAMRWGAAPILEPTIPATS